jgi:N-acetylmuramoyl-L-alanine amidase
LCYTQYIIKFYLKEVFIVKRFINNRFTVFLFILILVIICSLVGFSKFNQTYALSKYGSNSNEVKQIQEKLKRWGYYDGEIDGIYGSKTLSAVKLFQEKNGLTVDGIAGEKTLSAMGITSSNSSSYSSNSSSSNVTLLAKLIYGEARGEVYTGQVAVGAVVLNRVKSSSFPNTLAGVIYQSGAFDAVADGQINMSPDSTAIKAAQDAINGWDPSYGAIYYFNPNTATNAWIWSRPYIITIGNHRFCK